MNFWLHLKTPYLTYIVDSLTFNSWPTATISLKEAYLTCIFSVKHVTAFLHLETLDNTSALCWAPLQTMKLLTKSTIMQKAWYQVRFKHTHTHTGLQNESWNRRQSAALFNLSWTQIFLQSAYCLQMTTKAPSIDFWFANTRCPSTYNGAMS